MSKRTPDQIRDDAMKAFNEMAPKKYDHGQNEHGGLLDERKDILADCRDETIDLWFYLESARRQMAEKDAEIATLREALKIMARDNRKACRILDKLFARCDWDTLALKIMDKEANK